MEVIVEKMKQNVTLDLKGRMPYPELPAQDPVTTMR